MLQASGDPSFQLQSIGHLSCNERQRHLRSFEERHRYLRSDEGYGSFQLSVEPTAQPALLPAPGQFVIGALSTLEEPGIGVCAGSFDERQRNLSVAAPILTPLKTSSGSTDSSSPLQSTINDRAGFSTLCRVRTARQHRDGDCRHHHAIVERNDPPTL